MGKRHGLMAELTGTLEMKNYGHKEEGRFLVLLEIISPIGNHDTQRGPADDPLTILY